ncbi:MAG: sulfite exporter TauE/SafE family protein [Ostreibacterium sp.]
MLADLAPYLSLLLVGLLGSTHCIAMCGGLQQLFINMAPNQHRRSTSLFIYHAGRLTGYAIVTVLITSILSEFASQTEALVPYAMAIRLLAAIIIMWIGINHFFRLPSPRFFRIATDHLWKMLRGVAKPFLPPRNDLHIFIVGIVWGWLPCSLVYSALAISLSVGSITGSVVAMLCFGVGTMPALLGMGLLANYLKHNPKTKDWLAGLLIIIGLYALVSLFLPHSMNHMHHALH